MSRSPLPLAFAGSGRLVEFGYLPALRSVPELRLVAVADPDRSRRERVSAAAGDGIRAFASVGEMLDAVAPAAVVVASPPEHHLEHAALCADAGAAALVEKPPGRNLDEAEGIASLRPSPWIAFNRRFSHLRAIADKLPGEGPLEVSIRIAYRRRSWRAHQVESDALDDLGPHALDLARSILGPIGSVSGSQVEFDRAEMSLKGSRGGARLVCATDRPWSERVEVRAAGGHRLARSVHGGPAAMVTGRLRALRRGRGEHPLVGSLAAQLRAFSDAADGDGRGLGSAADGVAVMRAISGVRRSAAAGGNEVEP